MKLVSCYVENFGCLHDVSLRFSEGLNQYLAENGSGKSTLAAFITAMLYGMSVSTKISPKENMRKHYAPWQGGRYGGSLSFVVRQRAYTVVRYFTEKESTDTYSLYYTETGEETDDFREPLGESIFSVSRDAFFKSAYLSADEVGRFDKRGADVTEKLSRFVEEGEGAVSFETAFNILEKQRKIYIKSGNKGLLPETEEKLEKLRVSLFSAEEDEKTLKEIETELARLHLEKKELEKKEEAHERAVIEASHRREGRLLGERARELREATQRIAKKEEGLRLSFGEALPEESELTRLYGEAYAMENTMHDLHEEDADALPTDDMIRRFAADEIKAKAKTPSYLSAFLLAVALVLTVVGIFTVPLLSLIAGVSAIPLAAYLMYSLYGFRRNEKERDALIASLTEKRDAESAARDVLRQRLLSEEAERQRRFSEIYAYTERYGAVGDTLLARLSEVKERLSEYKLVRIARENASHAENAFLASHPDIEDTLAAEEGADAIEKAYASLKETQKKLLYVIEEKEKRLLPLRRSADKAEEYRREIDHLTADLARYKRHETAIRNAEKLLEESKRSLSSRYLSDMLTGFNRYLTRLLPNFGDTPILSPDLALKMKNGASPLSPLYYSEGTQDALSLCMHLALADALFTEIQPPILLDDPFISFDEDRVASGLDFLREATKTRQVLYFTCHASRIDKEAETHTLNIRRIS